jgi:hypothetical protein
MTARKRTVHSLSDMSILSPTRVLLIQAMVGRILLCQTRAGAGYQ